MSNKETNNNVNSQRLFTLSELAEILSKYSGKSCYKSGPAFYREILNPYYRKLNLYRLPTKDLFHIKGNDQYRHYDPAYVSDLCRLNFGSNRVNVPFMRIEIIKLIILYYRNGLTEIRNKFKEDFNNNIAEILNQIKTGNYGNIPNQGQTQKREDHKPLPDDPFGQLVTYILCAFKGAEESTSYRSLGEYPLDYEILELIKKTGIPVEQFIDEILVKAINSNSYTTAKHIKSFEDIPAKYFDSPKKLLEALIMLYIENNFESPEKLTADSINITRLFEEMPNNTILYNDQGYFHDMCRIICEIRPTYIQRKLKEQAFNEKTSNEFYNILEELRIIPTKKIGKGRELE